MHTFRSTALLLWAALAVPACAVLGPVAEQAAVRLDQEVTALYGVVVAAESDQDGGFRARERAAMSQIEEMVLNARSMASEIRAEVGKPASMVLPTRNRLEGNLNQLASAERDLRTVVPGIPLNIMRVESAMQELLVALDVAGAPKEKVRTAEPKPIVEALPVDWDKVEDAVVRMNAAVDQLKTLTAENPKLQKRVGGASIAEHFQALFAAAERVAVAVENREDNIAEATRALTSSHRRVLRFSRGALDKTQSALVKRLGEDVAVLNPYFQ